MKFITRYVAITAAALAFLWVTDANAATERLDLEARLPVSHPVFCADSSQEWKALTKGMGSTAAYTWINPSAPLFRTMWFSPDTCRNLADTSKTVAFADAAETLYHEWFHSHFLTRDEGETECLALFIYRDVMRRFWGFTPHRAQQLYKSAFASHVELGALFPEYRGTCTYPQHDPTAPRVHARGNVS